MEHLSKECYDKIAAELDNLIKVEFPRLTEALAEARAQGDLSENFEYHAAKRAQRQLAGRIRYLQHVLEYAEVVDTSTLQADVVGLLRKVTVTNTANNMERHYTIVAPHESEPAAGKLSVSSPIAKALAGHRVGDVVAVPVPAGVIHLRIDKIEIA